VITSDQSTTFDNSSSVTWDLQRLINWLRAAADAELGAQPMDVYSGLETSLMFEARANKTTGIRARFSDQFAPPTGRPWIDFLPAPSALQRFADALEHASAAFPISRPTSEWARAPLP
jgi:hypothetical protein